MRSRTILLAVLLAVLAAALAVPIAARAQERQKIKITVPTVSTIFYPLYFGQDKGIFAKENMDIEVISTNGDGPDVDAVISGSAQFAISTPNRLFTSFEQGKPLKAIGMLARRMAIDCAMNKQVADKLGITTAMPLDAKLKAMKGLTVAGTRPGAFTYVLLDIYGKRVGLTAQKDFQLIGVGGLASMLPALENNQIAIGCTGSPFTELAVSRQKTIRFTNNARGDDPAFDDFLFEMVYARPDYVQQNGETARGFLRALFTSVGQILDTPSADHMPMLKKLYSGVPDDVMLETFENTKRIYSRDGTVTPASVQKAGVFMVESGAVKTPATFEQVADNGFLAKR
jgi:ABC-type nitrate/sulfonate/bicarbonate transport system substrate-binding protein